MQGVFQQLRCAQFNTYTVKPLKQAHELTFFKRGSKGDFFKNRDADTCG